MSPRYFSFSYTFANYFKVEVNSIPAHTVACMMTSFIVFLSDIPAVDLMSIFASTADIYTRGTLSLLKPNSCAPLSASEAHIMSKHFFHIVHIILNLQIFFLSRQELHSAQINCPFCFAVLCSQLYILWYCTCHCKYPIEYTLQKGYSEDSDV